jgi:hypothetical protein
MPAMPAPLELAPPELAPPELAPPELARSELMAVQMLLLYAPPEPEVCVHLLRDRCCSAIVTQASLGGLPLSWLLEVFCTGRLSVLYRAVVTRFTTVGIFLFLLWWPISGAVEGGPWACELDAFRLLVCTTRTRNILIVQLRRMRMHLLCARAACL